MDKTTVTEEDISALIGRFSKETFKCSSSSDFNSDVMEKCLNLLRLDYKFVLIDNSNGRCNDQYPSSIPILTQEKFPSEGFPSKGNSNRKRNNLGAPSPSNRSSPEPFVSSQSLDKLINEAKLARCRNRFVVPVILYQGKYICRSSTIARLAEIGFGTITMKGLYDKSFYLEELLSLDNKRKSDVELLNKWKVGTIIDLMVENEKQKYLIAVTSSEKIDDTKKYSMFRIVPAPYPGCEFFSDFKKNNYNSEGLIFDWAARPIDSALSVTPNPAIDQLDIEWSNYKEWDLKQLTENYLSLMLKYIWSSSKGILIHCISGWDRTPMFISLLRMSLWADGVIHKSLSASQILYLTIAYDWYLFGHNLENRLEKGEDIMHFCFHFLKYIFSDKFKTPVGPSTATAPNSPKYSSNMNDFDLSDLDQLDIRSRHNSYDSNEDLSCVKSYDTLDECNGMQFDLDRPDVTKLKSVKKPTDKFCISETIYETDDIEKDIANDFVMAEETETKRYKCASPRRRHRSFRSPELDSEDEYDTSDDERNIHTSLSAPIRHNRLRTHSNSSDTDEWSIVTQTGSLNGNDYLSDYKTRIISPRERRLNAVRELFYKTYSMYGYKTDRFDGIFSKLSFNF